MNVLALIQEFCGRTGLPVPTFVAGSTDLRVIQLSALLNEVCEDLVTRWNWTALVNEANFTTLAQEAQGAIAALAPNGFNRILNDTIFNRTTRLPVYGPVSAQTWQAMKALPTSGPVSEYRIRGGQVLFDPVPPAGQECYFEYVSDRMLLDVDGVTTKAYVAADTDTFLLDHKLVLAGLRWKWKQEKGQPYAEEFARYEVMGNNLYGSDGGRRVLSMNDGCQNPTPGILIPLYNTVNP